MKTFSLIKVFSLVFITLCHVSVKADGNLDRSFSACGRVETSFGIDSTAKAIAVQTDGKIVVAGYSDMYGQNTFAVARYEKDGTIDTSFANDGIAITKFGASEKASGAHAVIIQSDGKIIAAGFTNAVKNTYRWCLARYNQDGSLDESFCGGRGIIQGTVINTFGGIDDASQVNALAIQADGKIIAAGFSVMGDKIVFAVARYNKDGSLDATFNKDTSGSIPGVIRTDFGSVHKKDDRAFAVAVQADGKIVVGGCSHVTGVKTFALARYLSDGTLDTSFYNPGFSKVHGTVVASFAGGETNAAIKALLLQADGLIVAGGYTNSCHMPSEHVRFGLARFLPCGELDPSFGSESMGMAVAPGTVITSFGSQETSSQINSMVMQSDGKIIAGGLTKIKNESCFALARYKKNGALDFIFNSADSVAGTVRTKFPGSKEDEIFCLALQPNGSLVAVGKTTSNIRPHVALARYVCMDHEMEVPSLEYPQEGQKIVNGSAIKVMGSCQNPGIVDLYLNDQLINSCYSKTKDWSMTLPALASGEYNVRACQMYPGGNVNLMSDIRTFIVDQHPKALNQQLVTAEDKALSAKLDVSGASGKYHYNLLSSCNGSVSFENEMFTFMPNIDEGMGSFDYEAIDSETACVSKAKILVTIHPLPIVNNIDYVVCQDISFEGNISDKVTKGLPPYSFALINEDENGMLKLSGDGSFVFMPSQGFAGKAQFKYQVVDKRFNKSKPGTITIEVLSSPIAHNGFFTICQDTQLVGTVVTLVSSGKPPYVYELVGDSVQNGEVELNKHGSFTFLPTVGFSGQASFRYTVTDANGCISRDGAIVVRVLEKPQSQPATFTLVENTTLSASLAEYVSKGTPLYAFNLVEKPSHGSLVLQQDGSFEYTPEREFNGTVHFIYNVTDANRCVSNNSEVTIVVNQKPKVESVNLTTCQDSAVSGSLVPAVVAGVAPFEFVLLNSESNELQLSNDGSFIYNPAQGFSGNIIFDYHVTDSLGITSDVGTISIEVYQRPDVINDGKIVCQDTELKDTLAALVSGGLAPYVFSLSGQTINGNVTIHDDGSYTFVPTTGFYGTASFNYMVTDAHNCTSQEAHVEITVVEKVAFVNPILNSLQDGILEGNLGNYILSGAKPFVFAKLSETNGTAQLNDDGSFSFIPVPGFTGLAGFDFEIRDANNCVAVGTITIMVQPKPIVADYNVSICQGSSLSGSLVESVVSGTPPYVFTQVGEAVNAEVQLHVDGSFEIAPSSDMQANFSYTISDAYGYVSDIASVVITVNQKPLVQNDVKIVCQDTELHDTLVGLVSGGLAPYVFSLSGQTVNGNVTIHDDGSYTFVPTTGFYGTASFNYMVTDAHNCTSQEAHVEITVVEKVAFVNPILNSLQDGILEGNLGNYILSGAKPFVFAKLSETNGTAQLNDDGSFSFIPVPGFTGLAGFDFEIRDANNCVAVGTITIMVQPKPIVADYNVSICQGSSLSGSLVESVVSGTSPYVFTQVGEAVNAQVQLNPDGSFEVIPLADCNTQANFQYLVTDVYGYVSDVAYATVNINPVPLVLGETYTVKVNNLLKGNLSRSIINGDSECQFSQVGAAQNGNAVIHKDGSFVFIPNANFIGIAQFSYQVVNSKGCKATATTLINVISLEDAVAMDKQDTRDGLKDRRRSKRIRKYQN